MKIRGKHGDSSRGTHWYTNGVSNVRCNECPDGYVAGKVQYNDTNKHVTQEEIDQIEKALDRLLGL